MHPRSKGEQTHARLSLKGADPRMYPPFSVKFFDVSYPYTENSHVFYNPPHTSSSEYRRFLWHSQPQSPSQPPSFLEDCDFQLIGTFPNTSHCYYYLNNHMVEWLSNISAETPVSDL